eukprot:14682724-Alexandrium_andersonii.AAC.1
MRTPIRHRKPTASAKLRGPDSRRESSARLATLPDDRVPRRKHLPSLSTHSLPLRPPGALH